MNLKFNNRDLDEMACETTAWRKLMMRGKTNEKFQRLNLKFNDSVRKGTLPSKLKFEREQMTHALTYCATNNETKKH